MIGFGVAELVIIFVFMPLIAVSILIVLAGLRILRGRSTPRDTSHSEETRLIQDLNRGFANLEKRVDSLETILLDRVRKEEPKTTERVNNLSSEQE